MCKTCALEVLLPLVISDKIPLYFLFNSYWQIFTSFPISISIVIHRAYTGLYTWCFGFCVNLSIYDLNGRNGIVSLSYLGTENIILNPQMEWNHRFIVNPCDHDADILWSNCLCGGLSFDTHSLTIKPQNVTCNQ